MFISKRKKHLSKRSKVENVYVWKRGERNKWREYVREKGIHRREKE